MLPFRLGTPAKIAAAMGLIAVITGDTPGVAFLLGQVTGAVIFVAIVEALTRGSKSAYHRIRGGGDDAAT